MNNLGPINDCDRAGDGCVVDRELGDGDKNSYLIDRERLGSGWCSACIRHEAMHWIADQTMGLDESDAVLFAAVCLFLDATRDGDIDREIARRAAARRALKRAGAGR